MHAESVGWFPARDGLWLRRYSVGIASTACAVCGRTLLEPWLGDECPFSFFYLSVLLTARIAGAGPAILAIVLGSLSAAHFFMPPSSSLYIEGASDLLQLLIYVFVNCVATLLFYQVESQRRIAENKSLENERLSQSLKEADERKDEFLSLLAHELRNPLAPIRSSLALLDRSPLSVELMQRVQDVICRQTSHLVRLTDDLLEVERFSRGRVDLKIARLDIRLSVREAIEMTSSQIEEKSHRLQLLLPEEPIWVEGDSVRLAQLLANLLGNAAKYTPSGGRITLQAEQFGNEVSVMVSDNGIGFVPGDAGRILEPFVQIDTSRTREYGGLGIGLTIVNRLVALHGGHLHVHSRGPGLGSCFTVRLKAAVLAEGSEAEDCPSASSGRTSHELVPLQAHQRRRILVVEDNRDSGELMLELLDSEGYSTCLALDGISALQQIRQFSPHVVILDIGLPGMDGYELARRIRRTPQGAQMRLIALTGWGGPADRALSKDAGINDHLVKPIVFSELLCHLEQSAGTDHSVAAAARANSF